MERRSFRGNPYWLFEPRPVREERLRAYVNRQHRAGRTLPEILVDHRLRELGTGTLVWQVVTSPETIRRLGEDDCEQIRMCVASIASRNRMGV
jgi:hypothetical protein